MKYTGIAQRAESGYIARVPVLCNPVSRNMTRTEALENIKERIQAHLKNRLKHGLPLLMEDSEVPERQSYIPSAAYRGEILMAFYEPEQETGRIAFLPPEIIARVQRNQPDYGEMTVRTNIGLLIHAGDLGLVKRGFYRRKR